MKNKIKVFIVDDSSLVRKMIRDMLSSDPDIDVVGHAINGRSALTKLLELDADVITLDVEMPELDGIGFLKKYFSDEVYKKKAKVIMFSSLTKQGMRTTFEALEAGAIDFLEKAADGKVDFVTLSNTLIQKVKDIFQASSLHSGSKNSGSRNTRDAKESLPIPSSKKTLSLPEVVDFENAPNVSLYKAWVIGSSTGGPQALRKLVGQIHPNFPYPICVVQHMPPGFTSIFAEHLNLVTSLEVREVREGEKLIKGRIYIGEGSSHFGLELRGDGLYSRYIDEDKFSGHKPSVDLLFRDASKLMRKSVIASLLTGMGSDGAKHLKSIKEAGGVTITQSKDSCVVYGMPKVADEIGASMYSENLENIYPRVLSFLDI